MNRKHPKGIFEFHLNIAKTKKKSERFHLLPENKMFYGSKKLIFRFYKNENKLLQINCKPDYPQSSYCKPDYPQSLYCKPDYPQSFILHF